MINIPSMVVLGNVFIELIQLLLLKLNTAIELTEFFQLFFSGLPTFCKPLKVVLIFFRVVYRECKRQCIAGSGPV
ncbi:hypothetical protein [Endozoicomonas atrinae]|uniref:hypothetical protein n=1 Tax=Endozoicomonas atrinae TaxID=1333660 RepID=UPI003AFFD7DD